MHNDETVGRTHLMQELFAPAVELLERLGVRDIIH